MRRGQTFQKVGGLRPRRSAFDLSYAKLFNCDMGQLVPVFCDEVVPGDYFNISNEIVIRMQPLVAPVLHEVYATTHFFFVPYRLLWDEWETFITGGRDGNYVGEPPLLNTIDGLQSFNSELRYSLIDYLGFPIPAPGNDIVISNDASPVKFPVNAYNFVYNEYYRDQNFSEPIDLDNIEILNRAWTKDYFTSALPWIQRGAIPALPVNTAIDGEFITNITTNTATTIQPNGSLVFNGGTVNASGDTTTRNLQVVGSTSSTGGNQSYVSGLRATSTSTSQADSEAELVAVSTSLNVADLRVAFQISKWQERNARSGVRYTEFLRAHYGVAPTDERLDRPEYIGGTKSPIIISEVLQTSSTDTTSPQGNLAGHGITADKTRVGSYHVKEFGLIIGIFSVLPKPSYIPQGVARQWTRRNRYDYFAPEFIHLSEEPVLNREIYMQGTAEDQGVFGYQGRYDEMRVKQDMVCGSMQDVYSYWHLSRRFESLPMLGQEFVECEPEETKRIYAVQDEPGLIVHYGNKIRAVRPLPVLAEPGLIDHF
ncbi:major capsid protein [Peromfec virus RodF8_66]|uniref:Major capsid protein n=1 Tax=Peromfec virus RodF8_66 TaxID=2929388 RepID=A0A976N1V8_9VIRU|nr:major capsid protein [Peromfec virus RodF8_66]